MSAAIQEEKGPAFGGSAGPGWVCFVAETVYAA